MMKWMMKWRNQIAIDVTYLQRRAETRALNSNHITGKVMHRQRSTGRAAALATNQKNKITLPHFLAPQLQKIPDPTVTGRTSMDASSRSRLKDGGTART
jgi:hypothetical protein